MAARGEGFRARAGYRRSSIARHLWKTTALTSLALALSGAAAYGDDAGLWQPQIRAIIGADNNGGNAALEGFIPIKQTAESVLFLDVRAKHDFKDAFGQDIGLGIRRIVNPDLMLGGYAYFNAESYGGTQFTGGTLGVEAITPNFDAHVNVFVPIKGDSTDHSTGSTLSMVSNQLIEQISVLDHRDYAAWGIEGEVGAKVPLNLPDKHSLRLDIGGYHFEDPHGDDGSVTGAKAGIEYEIGDVFGTGTSLTFTGEVRNDNRDDTQFAGSVRLNIPFNPGHGSDTTGAISDAEPVYPVSEGLRKRVNERVRGDIGVRVQSQDKTGGSTTRVAINAATNAAFGKFYFADGGLAGAGTQADPTTLDDAVTKAGSGGYVVALGGNGNLTTNGVTLATGQTVIGGGESVTAKLFGGGTATFNLGGSDGTIQGTNVANNVITLGNGNTLNGITITGGADGIFGNNVTGTTLTKVTVTGAGGNGAEFSGNSTNVKASDFTATNNGLDGLHIEDNGTYNFAGTTLLSGNLDDGLDITGQGTYTFATVNALDNTDRGITVQGTSSGGSFTTTGGTISGNGGIGVYIDPITAHVVLDSITQTGGTSGVVLDHVSGSFTVNGATTISNTTGPAIAISDSPAAIRFGDISITTPGGDGMVFSGVNAAVVAGNIVISGLGLGHTGLDFSGSQTTFTALSANISGSGAGSIGIDLADTTGDASITITNGGTISGVDTGVRLGIAGSLAHSANAEFTFGGGSIAGVTASLDARGLNQTLGHYAFGSTTFSGPQLFDVQNVIFVGAAASGSGDGSSLGNLASIGTADGISDSNAIFVLVNDAGNTPINATGGFSLSDGQTLASFGNGRSFSLGGVPVNVTGANIQHDVVVSDPGTGAATLTNSGAGDVVTLGNGNSLQDFNISGGSGAAIHGTGIAGLTVQGVTVSSVATGLFLDGVTGTVTVDDLHIQNASQTGIALVGSSATVNFTGNTTITNAANVALFANNFDGTATFDDLDITGGGIGVGVAGGSSGTLTFGTGSSIAGTGSNAFSITNSTPNVTYNGTISQTSAFSAVKISNMTGGSATFAGKITASTGAANAIDLTGNAGGKINFTGGLDLTTDGGFGLSAINGGTLNVTGTNTISTGAGPTEKGIQLGGASGLTIGASGVTFASVTVDGSGGAVPTGILIENTSGGNVTFGGVNISRSAGNAISLINVASGIYSFNGTTTIATVGLSGDGFSVEGSAATVNVNNLVTTNVSGNDVSLTDNTGTIAIGGTLTKNGLGSGSGVIVLGGSAAITVSADISNAGSGIDAAVDGTTGGSVAFSGSVTSSGTGKLFSIGATLAPAGGAISFTGPTLSATGGGGAVVAGLAGAATLDVTAPLSITNATGTGLSVANVASTASASFGAVTVTGASGNGIDITNNAGAVTFGATSVTMSSTVGSAGINFAGTNADVSFGTTNVTLGAGANQTGIDFSGSSTTADFGVTTITGTGDLTSRGIDLSSTTGNKTITFQRGSSISNAGVGVELSSGGTTATSANANFTFGDGTSADGRQSSISAAAGGYTVNTIGLDPTLGNYDFDDVVFTGTAHLASAVGGVIIVSQNGGVITAGTDGLSADVSTISVTAADAMSGSGVIFAFVGTVDLSGTPFTLDSGQSITGFGNGNSILTSGTVQPINVQGNLGATGGNVTGDEGVVKSTGSDTLHLLGSNQVKNTAFDFSGGSGSVFLIDQSAVGFSNAGGIVVDGVTVSNVAVGQTAFKVDGLTTNVSITNNNVNVPGTLLAADGGNGNITLTRGNLPNSGPAGTLTGGGVTISNRTGGLINFTDKATIGGNGVSLTNNTGSTITFADVDITTNGATAFTATGGGAVNVTTGTISSTGAQAAALDGITAGINFASTNATFGSGNGIDLQALSGTAAFGTGTLTNTGAGTSFNVGSATDQSGGNAVISYDGTIASNGTGAAVSIQELTGGSVTLSGNLTDGLTGAGGNIVVAGIDNGTAATVTFSGTTKQIDSGATDGVNLSGNPNGTVDFSNGGLDITTTTGTGFLAAFGGTVSVSGTGPITGNKIVSGGDGLLISSANVGSAGVTFDSVSAVSNIAGVLVTSANLAGDVNIGGLRDTGYTGAALSALTGTGEVNFTGTTDLDVSYRGFDIGGPKVGTINIANVAGSTLTIDGGEAGIVTSGLQEGTINVGGNGGVAKIGETTSTTGSAIAISGGNDLVHATLNYNGSIKVSAGSAVQAVADWSELNLSGSVVSTSDSAGFGTGVFTFSGNANGVYNISSTIDHSGTGIGVLFDGSSEGTATFSGTSKIFNTSGGTNDAIVKAPSIGPADGTGSLNFIGGNLKITTSSGTGFKASTFGVGTVSVSGTGNTITTTTGTAINLDGATVGAVGVTFDSITVTGAETGIALNNVSGGAVSLGVVDLQGITSRGVDISGTLGSTLDFTSLNIGLGAANAVGLDLNGAALGASNITAGDFDVDGGSFSGTIGIDMAGTTGTGTIQLGDLVNNNPGPSGQTSTIANVGYGVQFSSATNAKLVFGDGQGPAESSIATTGGEVIHATDTLPTNGDYNFNDVNFTGDISNLSSVSVYYVTEGGTGDGSLANPGSYAGAQASTTANVIVLIDQTTGGSQSTIDLAGTTFQLDDGQVLLAFKSGDAAVDVSQLGVSSTGGASGCSISPRCRTRRSSRRRAASIRCGPSCRATAPDRSSAWRHQARA
ncbi:S-layer family protein [Mesorhizobium sp. M8A.F.Ca.ET.057.01.1.1]|uniref:S-layer family protein n=3 Tax=unclassified Mesorhizobium TaxID=325217 RepID=UPI001ABF216C|nr:S-layer family protein [Mesorhizobium sp. M8A.F.Ca.ET.057.01.1.1]